MEPVCAYLEVGSWLWVSPTASWLVEEVTEDVEEEKYG